MKNSMKSTWRARLAAAFFAGGLLLVPLAAASAQATNADGRWDAFLGCWEPAGAPSGVKASLLCVVPAQGTSAADLVTVTNGKEVAREHIEASGVRVANTRDGCKGWESAAWSRDDERVYLHADYTCPGGLRQKSTALIGMSANGDLMDVQALSAGKNNGVRVTEYREVTDPGPLPADIASAIGTRTMAVDAARVAAAAPVTVDALAEASKRVDAPVVEAWLANRGEQPTVDAKDLEAMANAGVPGRVIDVMVALANPDKFAVNPAVAGGGQYADAVAPTRLNGVVGSADTSAAPICPYSAYGWDYGNTCRYSPWTYGYYGYPYWGYSPFGPYYGYNPYYGYGFGYGYGYSGWYGWSQPVVIVPTNGQTVSHGRVIKGRGYVQGSTPSSGTAGARYPAASTGSGSASAARGYSGGSSSSGSSGSSSGRTAHRRGGGGTI